MGNFKNLPTDIVLDIITRLPTESILDCKSVCRSWRNLVSHHHSFSQLHLTRILNRCTDSGKLSFLVLAHLFNLQKDISYYQLHYFDFDEKHDQTPVERIKRINLTPPFVYPFYRVIGSINGLVCLYGSNENAFCICNPVTREYVMLPKCNRHSDGRFRHWSCGFGYIPLTNEYKVVALHKIWGCFLEVAVYTVGSGNGWKIVGRLDTENPAVYFSPGGGVFVNGYLHWRDKQGGKVLAFDLAEEKFSQHISPPPSPLIRGWLDFTIGELDGDLYYTVDNHRRINNCSCFDIWLLKKKINDIRDMKVQVEHEPLGWSKQLDLPGDIPLAFTKSGGVLCFGHRSLGIYDSIASTWNELLKFNEFCEIFPHQITLASLKELGEEHVNIMDAAEIEETRTRELATSSWQDGMPGYTY